MRLLYIVMALLIWLGAAAAVAVFEHGEPRVRIVIPAQPRPEERFAARELAEFLGRATGGEFAVVTETEAGSEAALYVGDTAAARSSGIDGAALAPEEWLVRTDGDDLIVAGGYPRGVIYAVHRLLERQLGCRFLAEEVEVVPRTDAIVWEDFELSGQPAFRLRHINDDLEWGDAQPASTLHKVRNASNAFVSKEFGGFFAIGSPAPHHTYHAYSASWDEPEFFAQDEHGVRRRSTSSAGPGQWCLANPQLRQRVTEQLRAYIAADRSGRSETPPVLYDISQNDNLDKCVCVECLAVAARYGAYSGLVVEFINAVAAGIRDDYPEVSVRTFAYNYGQEPSQGIAAAPNVVIHLAPMGYEFNEDRDTMASLFTPANDRARERIAAWSKIAPQLAVWDYWILFATDYTAPYTNVAALPDNLRFYRDCGVKDLYVEAERPYSGSFTALRRYLGERLMLDPDDDAALLTAEFLAGYYGEAAAPYLRNYLDYMIRRQDGAGYPIGKVPPERRDYLDLEFFQTVLGELERAAAVTEDARQRAAVEREFIPVLAGLFQRWSALRRDNGGGEPPFDRERYLALLERLLPESLAFYFPEPKDRARFEPLVASWVEDFRNMSLPAPPFPEAAGKLAAYLTSARFRPMGQAHRCMDSRSATKEAMTVDRDVAGQYQMGGVSLSVVSFDRKETVAAREIPLTEFPADGGYLWCKLGPFRVPDASCYVALGWRCEIQIPLAAAVTPGDGEYTVYLSCRAGVEALAADRMWIVKTGK